MNLADVSDTIQTAGAIRWGVLQGMSCVYWALREDRCFAFVVDLLDEILL